MKIFVLGGYGKTGLMASELLTQSDLVTEVAIAGRNLERAEKAAAEIGRKAKAIRLDGTDQQNMTLLSAGYDLIINAAWADSVIQSIQAAINNRAHYCDMSWGQTLEDAKRLAQAAEAAGISVVMATGISPCITNMMGVHAASQLDSVEQLQVGRAELFNFASGRELNPQQWLSDPQDSLAEMQEYKSFLAWTLQRLQENGGQSMRIYHDGHWDEIDPIKKGIEVPLAGGGVSSAYPYFTGDDIGMLPCDLARQFPVEAYFSSLPPQLDDQLREKAIKILNGKIDSDDAVSSFYETVESDPDHWLTLSEEFTPVAKAWVRAVGGKDGRAARYTSWFTAPMWDVNGYFLTSVALVATVLKMLRGEVQAQGILLAEKVFEPQSFFDEVVSLLPEPLPEGKMLDESFEWLA